MKDEKITLTYFLMEDVAHAMNEGDSYYGANAWYFDVNKGEVVGDFDDFPLDEEEDDMDEEAEQEGYLIPIPRTDTHVKWEEMHDFISDLKVDESIRSLLFNTIQGSGAFGRFKDALFRIDKLDDWYEYSNRLDCKRALDWMLREKLIEEEDVEKGLRIHDEMTARRRQKKENLQYMQKGATVRCNDNTGPGGKITPGKQYKIIDEKPQHLMIRIRNDQNQIKWYPKAHFDLVQKAGK